MKKRTTFSFIMALILALVVTACGGAGSTSTNTNTSTGSSNVKGNDDPPAQKITLTLQSIQTDKSTPDYQIEETLVNNYMAENSNIVIEWDRLDTEQQKVKLKTQASSGEVADITMVNPGAQIQPFIDGKALAPLSDMLDDEFKGVFLEGVLDYYASEGVVYALPKHMNIAGIFYNKELFSDAGVEPPDTFEELLNVIEKLNAAGITPMILGGKDRWPLSFMFTNILQRVNEGPQFLDDVVAGNKKFTDPAFVEAIQATKELIQANAYQEGAATYDNTTASQHFRDGKAAMFFLGTWEVASIDASEVVQGKVGFIPFPTVNGKGSLTDYVIAPGTAYAIGANTKHLAETKAFLKYLLENYAKVAFEMHGAVGLSLKVDGDFKAAGYSDLAVEVASRFNEIQGSDMNFDNVIEPITTQTHLDGLQGLLLKDKDSAELAQDHQNTWDLNN